MFSLWLALSKGTPAEKSLEPHLAKLGVPYRFQHWIGGFADFAFPKQMLVVEVDGKEHYTAKGLAKDAKRTAKLEAKGWKVWRCTNEACLSDPQAVVARLVADNPELKE